MVPYVDWALNLSPLVTHKANVSVAQILVRMKFPSPGCRFACYY